MKKAFILLSIISLVLAVSSCKRTEINDPVWDDPVGFNILLEGSVNPAVQVIDGHIHTSEIYVRVTDSQGNPQAGKTVFFEQLYGPDSDARVNWGYFANNQSTYQAVTNSNGEVRLTFYWPTQYYSEEMWIHAVLIVDGRAVKESESGGIGNIPQDFIPLAMYRSGN